MSDEDKIKTPEPEKAEIIKKPEKLVKPEKTEEQENIEIQEKPEKKIKTKKTDKSNKGFFSAFFGFITSLLWLFAIIWGTMPWWIENPYVPKEIKTYILKIATYNQSSNNDYANSDYNAFKNNLDNLSNKIEQIEETTLEDFSKRIEQLELAKEFEEKPSIDSITAQDIENIPVNLESQPNNIEEITSLKVDFANLASKIDLLSTQTQNFETSIAAIEKKEASKPEKNSELDLSEVRKSFDDVIEKRDQALAVIASISLLEDAFNYGTPYENELELLKNILTNPDEYEAEITILQQYAPLGIKPLARLIKDFNDVAPDVAWASIKIKQEGVVGKIVTRLKSLVSFRRVSSKAPENSTESIVYNAEKLVNLGAIGEALKELEKISDEDAKNVITPWINDAKAFTETKAVLRKIIMNMVENATKSL